MKIEKIPNKDVYYTKDHEWIDFQGKVAYVGVCRFKLTGFREVQQIIFNEPLGFKTKGQIIATIRYNDYLVDAHMPVDGKVVQVNDLLVAGDREILFKQPENNGWIALIVPAEPHERNDLLPPDQYRGSRSVTR